MSTYLRQKLDIFDINDLIYDLSRKTRSSLKLALEAYERFHGNLNDAENWLVERVKKIYDEN